MDRRRFLLTSLAGVIAAPLSVGAQQRRVSVLMYYRENDPEGQLRARVFQQQIEKLGWTGRTLQVDYQWGIGDADWIRARMAEVLRLAPDVILTNSGPMSRAAREATSTVPIVFIGPPDPVADGLVASLAHPGGNATGFTVVEPSLGAKLLELLREVAPRVARVAVLITPDNPSTKRFHEAAATAAQTLAIPLAAVRVREPAEIEVALTQLGRDRSYGLIVPPDPAIVAHRKLIIDLAARHRLPAIYALRLFSLGGGLVSYGPDLPELFRQAAGYVDRILRGEKPANLPVQQPTKLELVINLKTAKALGLTIPPSLLARADQVIE